MSRFSVPFGIALALGGALAAGLRAVEAHRKSLWLDELHSLWTAHGADFGEVIERVRVDFHPPLYFLLLHTVRDWDPHVQRWFSIAFSLATLLPLLAIARSAGLSRLARVALLLVFATSPYQILYAAELRAYAALGFLSATMAWAAFTDRAPAKWRFAAFAAALGIGINVHYFAGLAALAILAARPLLGTGRRGKDADGAEAPSPLPPRQLVLASLIGFAAFLPWLLSKERWLITDPGKMWRPEASARVDPGSPHEDEVRLQPADFLKAATTPLRTQIPMIATLGRPIALPAEVAAEAFFAIVLVGFGILLAALSRGRDPPGGRRLWAPIAACAVMYLLGIVLCLALWKGFPGQYYIIGAWAWPLVCAALVDAVERPGLRAGWTTALVLAGLASGTLHVSGNSRENVRGAVGTAVEAGEPIGAIYTAVLWQPLWYPHALPFQVYAPGVATCEPEEVPPAIGGERRPVVVVTRDVAVKGDRSMPGAWSTIRKGRHIVRDLWIDQTIRVVVFEAD